MAKKFVIVIVIAAVFGLGFYAYQAGQNAEEGTRAHGFVDVKESSLGFERSGLIISLLKEEGQSAEQGEVLAVLDTQALEHQLRVKKAQCRNLQAQAQLYQNGYRLEEIAGAAAQVKSLEEKLALQQKSCIRTEALFKRKAVSEQERDTACLTANSLAADLRAARAQHELLSNGYREEEVAAAVESLKACEAESAYLSYQIETQSQITAPYSGVVRSRLHELGDYVGAGTPVFEFSQVTPKEVRVYVSERALDKVKVGASAAIYSVHHQLKGTVTAISETAMFTPKSVQTEELRPDLVYEVKITVADPDSLLRLGQAVSAEF